MISRNFATAAATRSSVRLLSLTHNAFRSAAANGGADEVVVEHVYSQAGYSLVGVYRGLPSLTRQLGTSSLDVAHLFAVPLALAPSLRRQGARVVVHVMTRAAGPTSQLLSHASSLLFDRWVDAYAVSSPTLTAALLARGVRRSKIWVIPPAIDTQVFQPGDRPAARRTLGLDPDAALFIYLGRLSPRRFPADDVARALALAAGQLRRPVQFVAISPGETFDGSENSSAYLRACADTAAAALRHVHGVAADVRFGNLTDELKITWLHAADAVLLPFSASEAVEPPLTLLEALACGATVLATPAANRSQVIRHQVNGFVYQGAEQLAERLVEVGAGSTATTGGLAERARQTVETDFSFAATADACARVWHQFGAVDGAPLR